MPANLRLPFKHLVGSRAVLMLIPLHVLDEEQVRSIHSLVYLFLTFALRGAGPCWVARVANLEDHHEVARRVSVKVTPDLVFVLLIDASKIVRAFVNYVLRRLVHWVEAVGGRFTVLLCRLYEVILLARSAGYIGESEIIGARRPALHDKLGESNLRVRVHVANERCSDCESLLPPKAVVLVRQGVLVALFQYCVARSVPEGDELRDGVDHK